MNSLKTAAKILVLIGAINWGLVGIGELMGADLNLVTLLVGSWDVVVNVVYILIGLAALYVIFNGKK